MIEKKLVPTPNSPLDSKLKRKIKIRGLVSKETGRGAASVGEWKRMLGFINRIDKTC